MAENKNTRKPFGTIKVRIKLPSNDTERNIVGGVSADIENLNKDISAGLLSIVTGNVKDIGALGKLKDKLSSNITIYDYIEDISSLTQKISNSLSIIESNLSEKGILGDIREILLDSYINNQKTGSINDIRLILDTSNAGNISEVLSSIQNFISDSKDINNIEGINYLEELFIRLNSLTKDDGIISTAIENTNKIPSLSKSANKNIHSLSALFNALNSIISINPDELNNNIERLSDIFKEIEKVLIEISNIDINDKVIFIKEELEEIRNLYSVDVANTAEIINKHQQSLDIIKNGTDKAVDVATSAKNIDVDDIKESNQNAAEIIRAISSLGLVMIIGGLIMSVYEPLMRSSIEFGFTLAIFLTELMVPIAILSATQRYLGVIKNIDELANFVAVCTFVMTIAALFFLIPGMVVNALAFGKVFARFLLNIFIPITLMSIFMRGDAFEYADKMAKVIIVCTFIMMIGALFMLSNTLPKNSLLFGKHLGIFMTYVLAPILAFGIFGIFVGKILENFASVVITCTLVMMIGAIFISAGGGKYIFNALKFGIALAVFMALIFQPFKTFTILGAVLAAATMKFFTKLVISCTIVMIIGALFMERKHLWKNSLLFGVLLFTFVSLILLPLHLFLKNKPIRLFAVLHAITVFIITSVSLFLIGAILIQKHWDYVASGLLFGVVLFAYINLILLPFRFFRNTLIQAFPSLIQLSVFIVATGLCIALGAYIFDRYGESAIFGAALIAGFVFTIVAAIKWLIGGDGVKGLRINSVKNAFILMMAIAAVIAVISLSIYLVAISGANIETMITLGSIIALTAGMVYLVSMIVKSGLTAPKVKNAISILGAVTISILLLTVAIWIVKKSEADMETVGIIGAMCAIMTGMFALVMLISKINPKYAKESKEILIILSGVLLAISLAIDIVKKSEADMETVGIIGAMCAIMTGMFALVMLILKIDTKSSEEAGIILSILAGVLLAISVSLSIVKKSGADWETMGIIGVMCAIVSAMILLVTLIAKIDPLAITVGSVALTMASLLLISLSISLAIVKKSGADLETVAIIGVMSLIVTGIIGIAMIVGMFAMNPITLAMLSAGLIVMGLVSALLTALSVTILIAAKAALEISKVENPLNVGTKIKDIFDAFLNNIPTFGPIEFIKKSIAIRRISSLAMPMARTIMAIGRAISDVANLKVAISWDKDGNPTNYRQLHDKDFDLVANNVGKILTSMSDAFVLTWEGGAYINGRNSKGLKEIANNRDGALWKTLSFSMKVGDVISSISEGLQAFAKLMVPIAWNDNGKPIKFRQMNQSDFDSAKKNIAEIIIAMADAIQSVYTDHSSLFDESLEVISNGFFTGTKMEAQPSPFVKVLKGSVLLGEVISGIATGIQSFANLMIPIDWNESGKPIKFRRMRNNEITEAKENIQNILVALGNAVADVYNINPELFDEVSYCTKDGWFKDEYALKQSKFMLVLSASKVLSEVICGIASGIKDFALMQIADAWNDKGVAIHYTKLQKADFEISAQNIKRILTILAVGIKDAYDSLSPELKDPEKFKTITDSFIPMGGLVSSLAKGVKEMANLQFDKYDSNGKIIGKINLTNEDFNKVGRNIATLLLALSNGIKDAWIIYKSSGISEENLKIIIDSLVPVGDLVSNLATSIITYSKAEFKDERGNKIKIDETVLRNVGTNISGMVESLISGIINIYKGREKFFDNSSKDSIINITAGINEVSDLTNELVGTIKKYSEINPSNIKSSLKNIDILLNGTETNKGILNVLIDSYNGYKEEPLTKVSSLISYITNIVSTIFDTLVPVIIDNKDNLAKLVSIKQISSVDNGFYGVFADIYWILDSINKFEKTVLADDNFNTFKINSLLSIKNKVNTFTNIVSSLIEASSGNLQNSKVFEQISKSISDVNNEISKIDINKQSSFNKEIDNLDKFVKVVDRIDTSKATRLTSLMEAMANLADKIGGFDKLAEVLDGDFVDVLTKLEKSVEEAKETIAASEKINARRQKQFSDNIAKLKEVMKSNITVGVGDLDSDGNIKVKNEK